ncbi:GntR family transcriptional regulator [uncultured Bradyrhizobium sp.]|jgi:DNA-binding GntR family transcriptional regulator|uniref:GntR family transcriptional regulator n=1 Tax=uncultured Bradyrhizobium sp. TaxID=199684 RepID=UPI0026196DF5|nr:GntR family transcriptional regulator [uncultured Bradyrhizobium sp.]
MRGDQHRTLVETAGERAYRRIRDDIIAGTLEPSQRLKLDALKETYGVSVSTLRELLNRLTSEGLIVAEGARGFEVAPISVQNFKEVANLRQLLESHALEASFAGGDMDWEGRVVAAHHKLSVVEARLLAGNRTGADVWKRYDFEFHHALLSACGSKVLLDTHSAVFDKYLRYLIIAVVFRGEVTAREHRALLECALKRDVRTAKDVLVRHIQECVAFTLAKGQIARNATGRTTMRGKRSALAVD